MGNELHVHRQWGKDASFLGTRYGYSERSLAGVILKRSKLMDFRGYRKRSTDSSERAAAQVLSRRVSENTQSKSPWGKQPTTVHLPGPDGISPKGPSWLSLQDCVLSSYLLFP